MGPERVGRVLWSIVVSLGLGTTAFFLFRRGLGFLIPVFVILPFWLGRRVGSKHAIEEEDPADWWKKEP